METKQYIILLPKDRVDYAIGWIMDTNMIKLTMHYAYYHAMYSLKQYFEQIENILSEHENTFLHEIAPSMSLTEYDRYLHSLMMLSSVLQDILLHFSDDYIDLLFREYHPDTYLLVLEYYPPFNP